MKILTKFYIEKVNFDTSYGGRKHEATRKVTWSRPLKHVTVTAVPLITREDGTPPFLAIINKQTSYPMSIEDFAGRPSRTSEQWMNFRNNSMSSKDMKEANVNPFDKGFDSKGKFLFENLEDIYTKFVGKFVMFEYDIDEDRLNWFKPMRLPEGSATYEHLIPQYYFVDEEKETSKCLLKIA